MKNFLVVTEHPVERVVRVLIGLAILSLVFVGPKTAWGWIGIIPVLTGLTGTLPSLHNPRDLHLPKEVRAIVHRIRCGIRVY